MDTKTDIPPKRNIRFDWAMKRLLRNKANYRVLEGFLSELLHEDVTIVNITDSEGNQDYPENKFNRVDIMVENSRREIFIIELQNTSEADYLLRMLYGVSRVITNYMHLGNKYKYVRKVYSVNIVYFEIGQGCDYIYHGSSEFRGIHHQDLLELSPRQKKYFGKETIGRLYPEYYLIKVNDFNDVAKDTLDEWIYYLKNDVIPEEFKAKGLAEARKVLRISSLSESEYRAYHRYVDQLIFERDALLDSRTEGKAEGLAEGLAKGTAEGEWSKTVQVVMDSHKAGLQVETIAVITRLSPEQIHDILRTTPDTGPLF